jgi:outer membrane protein TolC
MFVKHLTYFGLLLIGLSRPTFSQDTLRLSLNDFINRGLVFSDELRARETGIALAENSVREAKLLGILPRFELTTNHGVIPDVTSDSILANGDRLPREEYYLDPNLSNDWSKIKFFTQLELRILQPIYTWGAISNAVVAARAGAVAVTEQVSLEKSKLELRLYELYYARVLSLELNRKLFDATKDFEDAERRLQEMIDDGNPDLEESDIYKFRIFKQEFLSRAEEVKQNEVFLQNAWNSVLGLTSGQYSLPLDLNLESVEFPLLEVSHYSNSASVLRPESKAIGAGLDAASAAWKAQKAQRLPSIFLGLGAEYVYSPRPVERQPLFGNRYNYVNVIYSFGIRQNLNFLSTAQKADRSRLQYKQVQYSKNAIVNAVMLDANDKHRQVSLAAERLKSSTEARQVSKEWLRQEQINYDLGLGIVKNLVDAVKSNLELEVQYLQRVYEYNLSVGRLKQASGFSVNQ